MGTATNADCYDFHSGNSLPPYTSINAQAQDYFAFPAYPRVEVREFDDGIFIRLSSGTPQEVEYHEADVQVWRDKNGRIVAIDIVYTDDEDEAPE